LHQHIFKMLSRSSLRNLKHKAKKSLMIRIGRTESRPEDPGFKALLGKIDKMKNALKDTYNTTRYVVVSGKQHNQNIAKLCGAGLKGEDLFNKEAMFLREMEEGLSPALGRIVSKDIEKLNALIVEYKSAKLKFDTTIFNTVKSIKKQEMAVAVENEDEIMNANENLPPLRQAWIVSKRRVIWQRDVVLKNLSIKVGKKLDELTKASDTQHHQLYCQYLKKRLDDTYKICANGNTMNMLMRSQTFTQPPKKSVPAASRRMISRSKTATWSGHKTSERLAVNKRGKSSDDLMLEDENEDDVKYGENQPIETYTLPNDAVDHSRRDQSSFPAPPPTKPPQVEDEMVRQMNITESHANFHNNRSGSVQRLSI